MHYWRSPRLKNFIASDCSVIVVHMTIKTSWILNLELMYLKKKSVISIFQSAALVLFLWLYFLLWSTLGFPVAWNVLYKQIYFDLLALLSGFLHFFLILRNLRCVINDIWIMQRIFLHCTENVKLHSVLHTFIIL